MDTSYAYWAISVIYCVGWLFCCLSFFSNDLYGRSWGKRVLVTGLVLQLAFISKDFVSQESTLFNSLSGLFLFLSFFTIFIFIVLDLKFPNQIFKIIFPPVAAFFQILSMTISDQVVLAQHFMKESPVFGKLLLFTHASFSMLGYLLFGVACLTSIFFLYQEHRIKKKKLLLDDIKVPSLGFLDKLNYKVITIGFLFLSVGILLGINMKIIATGGEIVVSLRQLLPIATWLIFAVFLIDRFINGLRGKITAIWSITGFFTAVASFTYEIYLLMQKGG